MLFFIIEGRKNASQVPIIMSLLDGSINSLMSY